MLRIEEYNIGMIGKDATTPAWDSLAPRQQGFLSRYAETWNATRAWMESNPGCTRASAKACASRALTNANLQAALREMLGELGVTRERIMFSLAEMAFGADMADFGEILEGETDLPALRERGVPTHLLRRIKARRKTVKGRQGDKIVHQDIAIELYDRQKALIALERMLGPSDRQLDQDPGGIMVVYDLPADTAEVAR